MKFFGDACSLYLQQIAEEADRNTRADLIKQFDEHIYEKCKRRRVSAFIFGAVIGYIVAKTLLK